jgi:hypothetical protein
MRVQSEQLTMSSEDMDEVLSEGIDFAVHLLKENGEFYPFGVVKDRDSQLRHMEGWSRSDRPQSEELRQLLRARLQNQRASGEVVTAAVVSDARLRDRVDGSVIDAIRLEIDEMLWTAL